MFMWLDDLLYKHGVTPAELARASKINEAAISNIRSGRRNIGIDTALKIANALRISPLEVLRVSGLVPDNKRKIDTLTEELLYNLELLDEDERKKVLVMIRALADANTKGKKTKRVEVRGSEA